MCICPVFIEVDSDEYSDWYSTFVDDFGCESNTSPRFLCAGDDLKQQTVEEFQKLWNENNPDDMIAVDGLYGKETRARVLQSPISGF